ncbi:MAG: leucine-rich repeat protein [Spirochaetales bacterium]|nr:leucine-rich repeat protein [Spirochaetales bacterium]
MKNILRTKKLKKSPFILFLILFSMLFLTCTNLFSPESVEESSSGQSESSSSAPSSTQTTSNFTGTFSLQGAFPSIIVDENSGDNSNARTAFPEISGSGITFFAKATASGQTDVVVAGSDITQVGSTSKYIFAMNLAQDINWTITVGIQETGTDTQLLVDSFPVRLSTDEPVLSHNFVLRPDTSQSGNGHISLSMTVPASVQYVQTVCTSSNSADWPTEFSMIEKSGSTVTFPASVNVPAGLYEIYLKFLDSSQVPLYPDVAENIFVIKGFSTQKWEKNTDEYINSSGAFELTQERLTNASRTQIYVSSNATANEEHGSRFYPCSTLAKAVSIISANGLEANDYTIWVDGTVAGITELGSALNSKVKTLTICGMSANNPGVLSGGNGSVLNISTTKQVTLRNIQVTGGHLSASGSKGGGIYMASGTNVTLDTGTLIGAEKSAAVTSINAAANYAESGGGIYNNGGTLTVKNGAVVSGNYSSASDSGDTEVGGGGIWSKGGTVTLEAGATVTHNGAVARGGGVSIEDGATLNIAGANIDSNAAGHLGGGVYVASGSFSFSGGVISQNQVTSADSSGGGIYTKADFSISGNSSVPYGVAGVQTEGKNDIALASNKKIVIAGDLTSTDTVVGTILPPNWYRGTQVLGVDATYATEITDELVNRFKITDTDFSVKKSNAYTERGILCAPIYVSGIGAENRISCTADGNDADGIHGTKDSPFKTLEHAIVELSGGEEAEILIDGKISGNQNIGTALIAANCPALTIRGANGLNTDGTPKDSLNAGGTGTVLTVETAVPVTVKDLLITNGGGTHSDSFYNGGGLYVKSGSSVLLANGTSISGNFIASQGRGGGAYIESGASLFMYGTSYIGDKTEVPATGSSSTECANYSFSGGGIYNDGSVYLGYSGKNGTALIPAEWTGGVCRNSSSGGGGIKNNQNSVLKMRTGKVSYNRAISSSPNGTVTGGGIYSFDANIEITGGEICYNNANRGGGVHITGSSEIASLSGGKIIGNTATVDGGGIYYGSGTFKMSGNIYIPFGDKDGNLGACKNDVYLSDETIITVENNLSLPAGVAETEKNATITLPNWKRKTKFLTASTESLLNSNKSKFAFSFDDEGWEKNNVTDASNHYVMIDSPIYVASSGSDDTRKICSSAVTTDASGTKKRPFASLEAALSSDIFAGGTDPYTILIDGKVTGSQTIPSDFTTSEAPSLVIKGYIPDGQTQSAASFAGVTTQSTTGSALNIDSAVPVTIQDLTITGGKKTGNGGGINITNAQADVTIASGTVVTGNNASANGGGIYVVKPQSSYTPVLKITGGQICKNTAASGGGVFSDEKASLIFSGGTIGGSSSEYANSATNAGGGIYSAIDGTFSMSGGNVLYNKVTGTFNNLNNPSGGGGIYFASEASISGGNIKNNSATNAMGGGIYAGADTDSELGGTSLYIQSNSAKYGGGIFNTNGAWTTISGGTISGNTVSSRGSGIYAWTSFAVKTNACVSSNNDVYLPSGNTIYVSDSLNETNVATVTPANYKRGTDILSVASSVTINDTLKSKFKLSADNDGWERKDKTVSGNKYVYITSPIYVVDASDSGNTRPTGFNKGLTTGANGTKTSPYASIAAAAQASDLSEAGGKITIAGTLTGTQTISSVTNGVSSVTLAGYNTNATINGNANGSALTISVAKTFTIQQLQITNGKASAGGGINITSGSGTVVNLDSNAKVYSNKATSGGTGAGVYVASGATLNIKTDSAIYSNTAYSGNINGAGVYNVGTVNMSGGSVYSNSAYQGGGIYNAGSLSMTGGEIGKTNYYNSSSNAGGAIYNKGSVTLNNTISIPYGGSAKSNDIAVYYDSSAATPALKMISAGANLSASNIALTPTSWIRGKQILTGTAGKYSCFKMTDTEWSIISSSTSSTHAGKIDADIYVAPTGSTTTINSVTYGKGATPANGGLGTKAKPYSTITDAVAQCWGGPKDTKTSTSGGVTVNVGREIIVVGEISGGHEIGSSITTNKASGVWIKGINTSAALKGGFGASKLGSVLKISSNVPVTLQNLTISGGYNTNGGGIYVSAAGASLTLTNSVTVTGNTATSNGGGIYFAGTSTSVANLIMKGSAKTNVDANIATSNGGGVYLKYANLCMSGYTMIGGDTNGTAGSGDSQHSNKAAKGGGIYADTGSSVWLGYSAASDSSTQDFAQAYGIRRNYATTTGGGIYFAGTNLKIRSGIISYNYCDTSTGTGGGGIYAGGTTQVICGEIKMELNKAKDGGAVYIPYSCTLTINQNATISKNVSTQYGGAIMVHGSFVMSNGTIGGTTPANTASTNKNTASSGGGAIYLSSSGTFEMKDSAFIPYGGSQNYNDVYLSSGRSVKTTAVLSNHTSNPVYITPSSYSNVGTASTPTVLSGSKVSSECCKFTTPEYGYYIDTSGKLQYGEHAMVENLLNTLNSIPDDDYQHLIEIYGTIDSDGLAAIANAIKNTTYNSDGVRIDISKATINGSLNAENAFNGCSKLMEFVYNQSTFIVGSNTFKNCTNLQTIQVYGNNSQISTASWSNAFSGCNSLRAFEFKDSTDIVFDTSFMSTTTYANKTLDVYFPSNMTKLRLGNCGSFTQMFLHVGRTRTSFQSNVDLNKISANTNTGRAHIDFSDLTFKIWQGNPVGTNGGSWES